MVIVAVVGLIVNKDTSEVCQCFFFVFFLFLRKIHNKESVRYIKTYKFINL